MNASPTPSPEAVLACPMESNDASAATVRDYLVALLRGVWTEGEGFSGKRPFGNSGWEYEIYDALGRAGLIAVTFDEEGDYIDAMDRSAKDAADALVSAAIERLASPVAA